MKYLLLLILPFNVYALNLNPAVQTTGSYCTTDSPDFKELRYTEQVAVCNRNVSSALKKKIYSNYNIPDNEKVLYTIDHFVPLSIGGSNNENNLWPQPRVITSAHVEKVVFDLVVANRLNIVDARLIIKSLKEHRETYSVLHVP